jgi:single-strand DNA-binding protein
MTLASSEKYKDQDGNQQEKTEWHRIVVFGRQAENCSQYLAKGRACLVEGSLQTRKWQDQQGQDRYTTEIRAQRVVFMGGNQGQGQPQPQSPQQPANPPGPDQSWEHDSAPF